MKSRMRVVFVTWFVLVLAVPLQAQNRPPASRERFQGVGRIKGVGPGVLYVVGEKGDQWVVKAEAKPGEVSYRGTAHPNFLRPGAFVRFSCVLEGRNHVQSPITEIEVFVPSEKTQWGVFPDSGDEDEKTGEKATKGDAPPKKEKPSKDDAKPRKEERPKKSSPTSSKASAGKGRPSRVVGRVQSLKGVILTVAAGGSTEVTGPVSPQAKISVESRDLTLARPGDGIEIQGTRLAGRPGFIVANRLTVTASAPLGSEPPASRRREKNDKGKR